MVVHNLGLPQLLAGFGIERNEVTVEPPDEQLVIRIRNAAIVEPAASSLLNVSRNFWRIFPFRRSVLCVDAYTYLGPADVVTYNVSPTTRGVDSCASSEPSWTTHATFNLLTLLVLI